MLEPWGLALGAAIVFGALLGWPALIVMAALVVIAQVIRGQVNVSFLMLVVAFAALGAARAAMTTEPAVPDDLAASTGAQVRVESLPRSSAAGDTVLVAVRELVFEDMSQTSDNLVVLATLPEGELAAIGDRLEVDWSVDSLDVIDPGYASYVRSRGAVAVARIWRVTDRDNGLTAVHRLVDLRHRIGDQMREALPGDAGALAVGIVTGDDSQLSDAAQDAFQRTGTTHITAVSGSNVAMILAIWNLVIPAGRNRRLAVIQVVIIVSIWLYAVLVGLEPPALRAAIMASLILLASRSGRRPDLLTLLWLTSGAMVLWNPDTVRMVGFWLSVVATGAIVMRLPQQPGAGRKGMLRGLLEGVALAQVATLPISIMAFGTWSLTSVLANALLAPLMWLAFPLCFALALIVLTAPWIAPVVAVAALIPLNLALQLVSVISSTMPPLDFENAGLAGVLAVTAPCACGLVLLSSETPRWAAMVSEAWRARPVAVGMVLIGPIAGVLAGLLIVLAGA